MPEAKSGQGQSSHYDFSFAFGNSQFSDSILRIITEGEPEGEAGGHAEEVPVSTIVLVAKSQYFRRMLTGSFREGNRDSTIEIHLTQDERPLFMDLLRFIYTGSLPEEISTSFNNALKLLIIADRFDTPDCIADCSTALDSFAPLLDTEDALVLLSLPESLQQLPNLSAVMCAATASLVKEFGNVLSNPSDESFMQLPEAGVAVLLQAHDLKLNSEDVIVRAAMGWICHHFSDAKDRLDCLFRLVLPNIRFQSLSPKQVVQVCSFLKDPSGWNVCHFQSSDTCQASTSGGFSACSTPSNGSTAVQFTEISSSDSLDPARLPTWSLSEGIASMSVSGQGAASSSNKTDASCEKLEALTSALVAVSEHALMHGGTIPRGASLESCLTGRQLLPPRQSCRPPHSIFLDIPERLCRDWQSSNEHLATSAPTCASGRWFTLQAKIYPSESTLHVQLSCDKRFPGGEFSSFQIELQLCLQTAESRPAYLQQTRKAMCRYTSASASFGCRDFLGKPLAAALEQSSLYFPEGALRLRADVWLVEAEAST